MARSAPLTLHLIGNAHIDPVWLWDWREGLNEGIATCRTMVALMREFPEMTFIRGEASIYEYVEQHDPETFAAICRLVKEGRWDVVGGNYVQPDNNLPDTEPLLRQFVRGKTYFRQKFGVEVTAAWATDSFGHSAGLPDILAAAGITDFACSRPQDRIRAIEKPAFWWQGAGGAQVLAWRPRQGWYGTERDEIPRRLDAALAEAQEAGLGNGACFYGLGNHGGGPSRRHLQEIAAWTKAHPEVKVIHSGLHQLFAALRAELKRKGASFIPTIQGELNFCLRGCSASVAKFKYAYRKTQSQLSRAERTLAICASSKAATSKAPNLKSQITPLNAASDIVLFNAFHDILPGTSIERAYDDQLAQLGSAFYSAQKAENDALLALARNIDTRASAKSWPVPADQPQPVPVLIWNPHSYPVTTHAEIEIGLDSRPIWAFQNRNDEVPVALTAADGSVLSSQIIADENDSLRDLPWRKRAIIPVSLPAFGWQVVHMGYWSCATPPPPPAKPSRVKPATAIVPATTAKKSSRKSTSALNTITNGHFSLTAAIGESAVNFTHRDRPWLPEGLQIRLYEDPWGSWGGMGEQKDSWLLTQERERWKIIDCRVLETGPERASLWVRFAGKRSQIDFTFLLTRDARHIDVRSRVLFADRSARLKLVLPAGGEALYEVPGGATLRQPCGEVPGTGWVCAGIRNKGTSARVGFASDALYGFDTTADEFRATICRASRYGGDVTRGPDDSPWMPAVDSGELRFNFLLTPDTNATQLSKLAAVQEEPLVTLSLPTWDGPLAASGQLIGELPADLRLLALRAVDGNTFELRLQNTGKRQSVTLDWHAQSLRLGTINQGIIVTWQLKRQGTTQRWQVRRMDHACASSNAK